jgi:hypothetical protein
MAANNYKVSLELIPETNWRRDEAGGGREVVPAFTVRLEINSLGSRALVPVPQIVKEQLPIPEYELD